MKYVLPKEPFESREVYVRGDVRKTAVRGRNSAGYLYAYDEHDTLIHGLVARDVPVALVNEFDVYGVSVPAKTTWVTRLYSQGVYIKDLEGSQKTMPTNHYDMVLFGVLYGEGVLASMFNGKIRCLDGYDTQPLFLQDETGVVRIPDTEYDTTLPSSGEEPYKNNHPVPLKPVEDDTL